MAFANPPDAWTMGYGTWGTHAVDDSSIKLTGDYAIKLPSSAVAPVMQMDSIYPVESTLYRLRTSVRASRKNAGDNVIVYAEAQRMDGSYYSSSAIAAPVAAINTWEDYDAYIYCPRTLFQLYAVISKAGVSGFDAWVDHVELEPCPVWFNAWRVGAGQSVNSGSTTVLQFDTDTNCDPAGGYDTSAYRFVAPHDGVYCFSASAFFGALSDGKMAELTIRKNGAQVADTMLPIGSARSPVVQCSSGPLRLNAGDYVEVAAWHDQGAAVTISNSQALTWFRGFEVA